MWMGKGHLEINVKSCRESLFKLSKLSIPMLVLIDNHLVVAYPGVGFDVRVHVHILYGIVCPMTVSR